MKYLVIKNYNLVSPRTFVKSCKNSLKAVGSDISCNGKNVTITWTGEPHEIIFDILGDFLEDLCDEDNLYFIKIEMLKASDQSVVVFNCDNLKISARYL